MGTRNYIQFILDGEVVRESHLDPTMSVLQYLRERRMKTGTKEGCAEGDCGACTVVLRELVSGEIKTRSVNACILFVPALDGKELVTVESIGTPDAPHEIQKLVAEKHGSQCGFCTPGIIMSLIALQADDVPHTHENIGEALAGNLCRCTGYGPIIDAAKTMAPKAAFADNTEQLAELQHDDSVHLSVNIYGQDKQFFIPKTLEQLTKLRGEYPDAILLAGGTDIGLWVTKHHMTLTTIIYLGHVEALNHITQTSDALHISAGVTYADTVADLGVYYPDMDTVMRRIGAAQIRNLGTIGGNIANGSPIGDMPPLLIAAGAKLVLQGADGERIIALENYFIDYGKQDLRPGEFVREIIVPKTGEHQHYFAYKISKRFESDISAVCMGMSFDLVGGVCANVRIAYGGMAATPKRAKHAEAALENQEWNEANARAAMAALTQDFAPIDDMRASKSYRMQVAQNLILKAWLEDENQKVIHVLGPEEIEASS
ncbi:MAG: xanthine dehydrogenase small subunit [Robiginitomaculum sp.]|nr:xanthine dehydrogenase small subunit [Robiginitomaculum sp.]